MEYGTALGLAQDLGFDQRINDERYRQEALKRQQDQNAAKAKLFASDMDFQKAANQFDAPRVRDMNTKIVQEIGDYVAANPDWETNVQKSMIVKQLKTKLKDNPEVMRALHSDTNYKELLNDLQERAKSGSQYDKEAYDQYLNKWNNYQQFGNQDGVDAAKAEGVKPFTYVRPQDFVDLPTALQKAGNSIKNYDVIKPKGGNVGEWYTKPKDEELAALKAAVYQQHGRQIQVEARRMGLDTPEKIDKWISDGISSGFDKSHSIGDPNAAYNRYIQSEELKLHRAKARGEAESNPNYKPFDYIIDPKTTAGQLNPDDIKSVWGNTPANPVIGNSGKKVDVSDFPIVYTGQYIKKQGLPWMLGKINMPLEVAQERGIYSEPFGPDLGRSGEITADFVKTARIANGVDKEGKPMKYVQIDYNVPVKPLDKPARDKFNAMIQPAKMFEDRGDPYASQQDYSATSNVPTASVKDWLAAGWTESQIKQGLKEGIIKVK